MPVQTGTGPNQFPTVVRHVTNGEPATETVFKRPSEDLEERTDALQIFVNAKETAYFAHDHTGDGTTDAGLLVGADALSDYNQANGVAPLDSNGHLPLANLPTAILGGLTFQGTWNAATNTPALPAPAAATNSSLGNEGWYYIVATAGTPTGVTFTAPVTSQPDYNVFNVGDWVLSNGTTWAKVDNTTEANLQLINALALGVGQAGYAITVTSDGTGYELTPVLPRLDALEEALPLRMYALGADTMLRIAPNQITTYDESKLATPPMNNRVPTYPGAVLDLSVATGWVQGGSGTVLYNGSTFALPNTNTIGQFYRLVFTYRTDSDNPNAVDSRLSNGVGSQEDLPEAGTLFKLVRGNPMGWVDLVAVSASAFKTATSVSNYIENKGITRFGSSVGLSPATVTESGGVYKQWTGYNKIIGTYGDYASLSAMVTAVGFSGGDSILVISGTTETAAITVSANNVRIDCLPNVNINFSGTSAGMVVTGTGFTSNRLTLRHSSAIAGTVYLNLQAAGAVLTDLTLEANTSAITVTTPLNLTAASSGCFVKARTVVYVGGFGSIRYADAGVNNRVLSDLIFPPFSGSVKTSTGSGSISVSLNDCGTVLLVDTSAVARTLPLPTALKGFSFTVIDSTGSFDTKPVTLQRVGSETISGSAADTTLNAKYGFYTFIADGTNWWRIA